MSAGPPAAADATGGAGARGLGRDDAAALAALLLLALYIVREPLLLGRGFYERDVQSLWYPQVAAFVRAIGEGSWPLWDPHVSFGHPLLAQPNYQVTYPPAWLNLLLEPAAAYTTLIALHVAWSAFGLYALSRHCGTSRPGSATAAALWAASGPYLSYVNMWNHMMAASWLPWVLLGAEKALDQPTTARRLRLGSALATPLLAGSPDMALLGGVLTLAAAALRPAWRQAGARRAAKDAVSTLAAAGLLALALGAIVWWPALDAASRSARWGLPESVRTFWSLHPAATALLAFPVSAIDAPLRPEVRALLFEGREPFLYSLYLGLPALVLVVAGLAGPARPRRGLFAVVGLAALLFALGRHTFAYQVIAFVVPPLQAVRYPVKVLVLSALATAVLAGMGVDAWASTLTRRRRAVVATAALLLAAVTAAGFFAIHFDAAHLGGWLFVPAAEAGATGAELLASLTEPVRLPGLALAIAAAAALVAAWRPRAARATALLVAALGVAELLHTHRTLNPTAPRELLDLRPPQVDAIRATAHPRAWVYLYDDPKSRRWLGHARALFAERGPRGWPYPLTQALALQMYQPRPMLARWSISGSFDPDPLGLYPRPVATLTDLVQALDGSPAVTRLLQLGAVTHVVALHAAGLPGLLPLASYPGLFADPIRLFGVPDPLPLAYVVGGARIADDRDALRILLDPAFDPWREIVLSEGVSRPPRAVGSARIMARQSDRVRIEVALDAPGFAVFVGSHDPGWQARVDGAAAPLLRANVAFCAVPVSAGRHEVDLTYRPRAVVGGLAVTGVSVVALLAWGAARARLGTQRR